jgi:hypothetical protein
MDFIFNTMAADFLRRRYGGDDEVNRRWDAARAGLVQSLGNDDELVEQLLQIIESAVMMTHARAWRQHPKVKQIRTAAADLARSLDALGWLEFQTIEAEFNEASRRIFSGWTISRNATLDPKVARRMEEYLHDPDDPQEGFLVRFHAQTRQLAEAGAKRRRGRPKDKASRLVAVDVGTSLLLAGKKAPVSENGLFANVVRVVLQSANLAPPANMFRMTAGAMKEIKARIQMDANFAKEVRQAQRPRGSTDRGRRRPHLGK